MTMTAYCRKCKQDVPPGDTCPHCGGRLTKASLRVAWCVEHRPVKDWMCWNSAARIILPAYLVVLLLILLLEGLSGGGAAVARLLRSGLLMSMAMLLAVTALVLLALLTLQGRDLQDCVVDSKGVHVQQYLVEPTPLKLLLRFRDPRRMADCDMTAPRPVLLIAQREIAWRDIARVQLWPEKLLVLFYAPTWLMRIALPCTPFSWADTLDYMRDKVGRRKNLLLPGELIAPPKPRKSNQPAPAQTQLSFDDLPPAPVAEEAPADFIPLDDVLAEIKAGEAASADVSADAPPADDPPKAD